MVSLAGEPAPTFGTLLDQNGQDFDSTKIFGQGQAVALFFYPSAMTYGCTKEACSIRDTGNKSTFTRVDNTKVLRILVSRQILSRSRQSSQRRTT